MTANRAFRKPDNVPHSPQGNGFRDKALSSLQDTVNVARVVKFAGRSAL